MSASLHQPVRPPRAADDPCPRLLVVDHSLVIPALGDQPRPAMHDHLLAVYLLCADRDDVPPLTVMEISARLEYPRAAVTTWVGDLVRMGAVQVSDPRRNLSLTHYQEVLDGLHA